MSVGAIEGEHNPAGIEAPELRVGKIQGTAPVISKTHDAGQPDVITVVVLLRLRVRADLEGCVMRDTNLEDFSA